MFLVGLTGGIAAGKSTVSRCLAEHGAVVIDADRVARDVVDVGTSGLAAVVREFGPGILRPDGSLDRAALGAVVFGNPERLEALNHIVHPLVKAETSARIHSQPDDAVVVYDVPLLVEANVDYPFDLVAAVSCPPEIRVERLVAERGMERADAERRISSQASDSEREARADIVIHTDGSLSSTLRQADELWRRISGERRQGGFRRGAPDR